MRPKRQVRRHQTRPTYGPSYARRRDRRGSQSRGRGSKSGISLSLPQIRINTLKWAAIGVVLLVALVVLSQITRLQEVRVSGNQTLEVAHLQQLTQQAIARQWFGRNTVLLNSGAIADYIKEMEPAVKTVEVRRRGVQALEVAVSERQPSLNWKSNGMVYLLDADGTVIGPGIERYAQLPTVVDSTNLPVEAGERVAPAAFVAFCKEFIEALPQTGLKAVEVTVPETTSEVHVKTDKNYILKLDTTRAAAGEIADLKAVQGELARAKKAPVEYIDLRIEHRAYYK